MSIVQLLLQIIGIASAAATPYLTGANPAAEVVNVVAAGLVRIVQAALAAHQQVTGQPIDLAKLQPIDPVV